MQDEIILQQNYDFFLSKKDELLQDLTKKGKYVVIHEKALVQFFDNFETAFIWAKNEFTDSNFLVQHVIKEEDVTNFIHELQCR